ncbi:alpha/beta fold hydrolase [Pigmentibacter ruber]|uniref:alpha/beta fold hydrolase n=1 Tax=Pigmentibacter ruber TaxID=2683196 RepID=UPI00131DA682|nr:alpha/beta fold hydrolase [Pigmentibacter ruber]BFD31473.1 alpha/beta hydrolase [Pigmentibacter ruber]
MKKIIYTFLILNLLLVTVNLYAKNELIQWKQCNSVLKGEHFKTECGVFKAPLDWENLNNTRKIFVDFIKVTEEVQKNKKDALFVSPGGPGGNSVEFAKIIAEKNPDLLKKYDIIGLNSRGFSESMNLQDCNKFIDYKQLLNPIKNQNDYLNIKEYSHSLQNECLLINGDIMNFLSVDQITQDYIGLLEQLNYSKINYFGASYSSVIALNLINSFPKYIDKVIIDSNLNQVQTYKERIIGQNKAINRLFDHLNIKKSLLSDFELIKKKYPKINEYIILNSIMEMIKGNGFKLEDLNKKLTLLKEGQVDFYEVFNKDESGNQNTYPLCLDIPSNDLPLSDVTENMETAKNDLKEFGKVTPYVLAQNICSGWDVAKKVEYNIPNNIQVLILTSDYDIITPKEWSLSLVPIIPQNKVVSFNGKIHGVYMKSKCARKIANEFLLENIFPKDNINCTE